jgi:hypothetical protein
MGKRLCNEKTEHVLISSRTGCRSVPDLLKKYALAHAA